MRDKMLNYDRYGRKAGLDLLNGHGSARGAQEMYKVFIRP